VLISLGYQESKRTLLIGGEQSKSPDLLQVGVYGVLLVGRPLGRVAGAEGVTLSSIGF
jgi:hypothetical protein